MIGKIRDEDLEKIAVTFKQGHYERNLQQVELAFDTFDHFKMDIAFTGYSGSGKSSLINTLRGLSPQDEEAAPTGVVETTITPTMYQHPNYPDVRLWDLPGLGTPSFASLNYIETMNFDLFDIFIIVASERMKESNLYLVDEILKRQKSFYFVRSKVDNDLWTEGKKRGFRKSCVLEKMRKECVASLETRIKDPQVFLISACEPEMYDFKDLRNTLEKSLPDLKKRAFILFLGNLSKEIWGITSLQNKSIIAHSIQSGKMKKKDLEKIESTFQKPDLCDGAPKVQAALSALDHFTLDVAVIGNSGSGTSSFINALRGLKNNDQGAAPTASAGSTKEPTAYPLPRYPQVQLWDITRMQEIVDPSKPCDVTREEIDRYDFYLIIVSEWPAEHHIHLSQVVAGLNKRYYFVQLKIDCLLQVEQEMHHDYTSTLERIRENYVEELLEVNVADPQIFLVSSFHRDLFDFADLNRTLHEDLPTLRRQAFILHIAKLFRQKQEERACRIL